MDKKWKMHCYSLDSRGSNWFTLKKICTHMVVSTSKYISDGESAAMFVLLSLQQSNAILSDAESMLTVIPFAPSEQCLDHNHSAFEQLHIIGNIDFTTKISGP